LYYCIVNFSYICRFWLRNCFHCDMNNVKQKCHKQTLKAKNSIRIPQPCSINKQYLLNIRIFVCSSYTLGLSGTLFCCSSCDNSRIISVDSCFSITFASRYFILLAALCMYYILPFCRRVALLFAYVLLQPASKAIIDSRLSPGVQLIIRSTSSLCR